ncbi:MAG: biosynthetic-type acetolactate synthase large subunit [Firmicutes bacterium]|nr:biosynthetic-type acetolactate synthase large subunit [Bacillota bacterium]
MKLTGAEVVMNILLEHGVDTVFGYPGGTALFLYDELYKYSDKIKHVLTAHEQGAAHAADGYARATGKTGVAFATSGPGATNLVTGIATAYLDSIPTVFITANVGKSLIGRDAFQEICITGVTFPITKHSYFVNKPEDLVDAMRNAFRIANEGRKGPVLVDITKDVTNALVDYEPAQPLPLTNPVDSELEEKLDRFAETLSTAKRPVMLIGGGVISSNASNEVYSLVKKLDYPVVSTLMGLGGIPEDDPRYFGMLGMHGSFAANKCVNEADVLLVLGARFSDRVALKPTSFAPKAKIIQIDIDKSEINKNVEVEDYIIGDIKAVISRLLPKIEQQNYVRWIKRIAEWDEEKSKKFKNAYQKMNPQEIIEHLCDASDKETIFVTDVGQHQMWAAQYVKQTNPRNFLSSGGLGTMGFGYGAAIGAQLGNPSKRVIHLTGDGSFHMNLNEACTAVSQNLPIITVIFNNTVLGMVYQWQTSFYDKRYSQTTPERKTNFVKLIEAFGGTGFRVENMEELKEAYQKALKIDGPVWIDCDVSAEDRVLPMIPNGNSIDGMLFE